MAAASPSLERMSAEAKPAVSNELWELVAPLIPKVERRYRVQAASGSTTARC
jgi:hypothetical protein